MNKRLFVIAGLVALTAVGWTATSQIADRVGASLNQVRDPGPYEVSESVRSLHDRLFVADLHADPLLWPRDLRERGRYGQVDLPRLLEGGVGLQVFGVVTKTPKDMNFDRNTDETDRITGLALADHWPPRTWFSLFERARYQARKLERLADRSEGRLTVIRNVDDLETLVEKRAAGDEVVGALLGLEGAHALEGSADNLDRLHAAGLRMLGLAHFFDNAVAGSAHGVDQGGLTELGREVVTRAERLGIAIDLAHVSPAAFRETTKLAQKPVVVSHGGVKGTCDSPRNLSDAQLRAVAATGGVVGIGLFRGATCGNDVAATLKAIRYAASVVGVDHVALGSDFDGAITAPIDASGLALVTAGLLESFSEGDVGKIMGGNVLRVLRQTLPSS